MKRLAGFLGLLSGFIFFAGTAIYLQTGILDQLRREPNRFHDSLYLPSSQYVKLITVGYDQFAADFLWLRAIQTFGATYANKESLGQLNSYFDVITDLDPRFIEAYSFGNMVLGEEAHEYKKALALLDKGIENNPGQYRLPFEGSFFAFWTMNDAPKAKAYAELAMQSPDCPEFVRGWIVYFDLKMGRYIAAYENYLRQYVKYTNEGNNQLSEIRLATLRRAIDEWYVRGLRDKATEYWEKNHKTPTVAELEKEGAFRDEEWPNWMGLRDYIDQINLSGAKFPDSEQDLEALPKRFLVKGWTRMPRNPATDNPHFPGYLVWPGVEPYYKTADDVTTATAPLANAPPDNEPAAKKQRLENQLFVISEIRAALQLKQEFRRMDNAIAKYRDEHNGECPPNLEALPGHHLNRDLLEPWGGKFYLYPLDCKVKTSTFANRFDEFIAAGPPI